MGAQIRVYRQKIASTSSMKKIFKAMEMIATSRINKARNAAQAAGPYANALTRVVTAVATQHGIKHPLIHKPHEFGTYEHRRSAILVVTSDRGLAGSYSSAILRRTESLIERLRSNGQEVQLYLVGRKTKAEYEQAASFEFEPSAEEVLNELLPRYGASRIFSCLLQAAASELASRQRAMKTAGDNAETLITKYTRLMNNARQAEITQELSEIVGGADALGS